MDALTALTAGILALNNYEHPAASSEADYDWLEAVGPDAAAFLTEERDNIREQIHADCIKEATHLVLTGEGSTLISVPHTLTPAMVSDSGTVRLRAVDLLRELVACHDQSEARARAEAEETGRWSA